MTRGDMPTLDHPTDDGRESEHAQQICDRRPIFPYRVGDLLLREPELVDQALVALRLFEASQQAGNGARDYTALAVEMSKEAPQRLRLE